MNLFISLINRRKQATVGQKSLSLLSRTILLIIPPTSLRWPSIEPDQAPNDQHNADYETNHAPVYQIAEDNNHGEL